MEPYMSLPVVALIAGVLLAFLALLTLELLAVKRIGSIMSPAMEYARVKAEQEAEHILTTARENARALLSRAEANATAASAERAKQEEAARRVHDEALKATQSKFEAALAEVMKAAQTAGEGSKSALTKEIAALGVSAKTDLKAATEASAKTFAEALTAALAEARTSIATYEAARKAAVDARIRELVAETTKIALGKSLPESAHAELVLQALAEAKASNTL